MRKYFVVLLFISCSACVLAQSECKITYISNEGFMVETAGRKILMDALFGGFRGNWCDVPDEETKVKMENAESPYDKTDLVTISHRHSDHFDAGIVMKHLIIILNAF